MNLRKSILPLALILGIGGAFFAWKPIQALYFSGVPDTVANQFICIPTGSDFEQLVQILIRESAIKNEADFRWVARQMSFTKARAGRFEIQPGWSNRELIQHLRAGKQAPVKVVFNSERLPEDVAGKVSRFIEADSVELVAAFRNPVLLTELGYDQATLPGIFIPNTYEMYWNTSGEDFLRRMAKENELFWGKNDRDNKLKALNMTRKQVYTLASIVERESNYNPERPAIAGVYLNRLRIDMRLQADPTCVFATRDFATRRVTQYHTSFDSPYNTYLYKGLPPGPISLASIPSIDAVLNADKHAYLYFCAKPDESGTHAFASTLQGHNVNAERFRAWMRTKGL